MKKRSVPLHLARVSHLGQTGETLEASAGENTSLSPNIPPEEAASYIADLLASLRSIAVRARLDILSDLIEVAQEEALLHCQRR